MEGAAAGAEGWERDNLKGERLSAHEQIDD